MENLTFNNRQMRKILNFIKKYLVAWTIVIIFTIISTLNNWVLPVIIGEQILRIMIIAYTIPSLFTVQKLLKNEEEQKDWWLWFLLIVIVINILYAAGMFIKDCRYFV